MVRSRPRLFPVILVAALVASLIAVAQAPRVEAAGNMVVVNEGTDIDVTDDTPTNNDIGVAALSGSPPTGFVRRNGSGTAFVGSGGTTYADTDCTDVAAATFNHAVFPPAAFLPEVGDVYVVKDGTRFGKMRLDAVDPDVSLTVTWDTLGDCGLDPPPVSGFTFTTYDQIAFFADTSTNGPTSWSWDFGDGSPLGTQQHPAHFFPGLGPFTVELTASSPAGTGSTFSDSVSLVQEPSTTSGIGSGFDLDGDGMNDIGVISPDGCGGNVTLQTQNGATRHEVSKDYRSVDASDVPFPFPTTSGNFCGTEGVPGLSMGFIVKGSDGLFAKFWTPELTATNARMIFELLPTAEADLEVTKTDSPDPVIAGETLTYTVRVDNHGPDDAENVSVADTLPSGVTFVSTSGCDNDPNGAPTCQLGTITNGSFKEYTIEVTVDPATTGAIVNDATASTSAADSNGANDTGSASTTVNSSADISVTKTDGAITGVPGNQVVYTVTVVNNGPSDDPSVSVTDTFTADLPSCSWTALPAGGATGATSSSGDLADTLAMPAGSSVTYTITCDIDPGATGTLTNTVDVAGSFDANSANDSASDGDTSLVPSADISVTKTDGSATEVPGTQVVYTITVVNNGPSDDPSVGVTDTFAAILENCNRTAAPAGGATGSTAGAGDITDTLAMPAGSSVVYTVTCDIDSAATGNLTNTATVTGSFDPDGGNDSATDTDPLVPSADISVTKTDGSATEVPGTQVVYTITVVNNGPSDDPSVGVTDTFAAILENCTRTAAPAGGATGATAGAGDITDTLAMPADSSVVYTVTCDIDSAATGNLTNTVDVAGSFDAAGGNDSASDIDTLTPMADLVVTKTDAVDPMVGGDLLVYTITVTNNGPSDASTVTATDTLPGGVVFVATNGCAEDPAGVPTCILGPLPAGAAAQYTVTVATTLVGAPIVLTNTANASSATPDPAPGTNTAVEETTVNPLLCAGVPATIVGTEGDDVLVGTAGDDVIHARGGNDLILGGDGHDLICTGIGDDVAIGGSGNDTILGDLGADDLRGNDGDDTLSGDLGADILRGGDGNDTLFGGGGPDDIIAGTGDDFAAGGDGGDTISGGPGNDRLNGGAGPDTCTTGEILVNCDP